MIFKFKLWRVRFEQFLSGNYIVPCLHQSLMGHKSQVNFSEFIRTNGLERKMLKNMKLKMWSSPKSGIRAIFICKLYCPLSMLAYVLIDFLVGQTEMRSCKNEKNLLLTAVAIHFKDIYAWRVCQQQAEITDN